MKILPPFCLLLSLTLSSLTFAKELVDPGQAYFQRGNFEHAAQYWHETLSNLSPESSPEYYIDTSMHLANAYQRLGRLQNALEVLHCVESYAFQRKDQDTNRYAKMLSQLGSIYLAMCNQNCKKDDTNFAMRICPQKIKKIKQLDDKSNREKAKSYLEKAKTLASNDLLKANISNKLGNLWVNQQEFDNARQAYEESITLAEGDNVLKLKALLNLAQIEIKDNNTNKAKTELKKALQQVNLLPDSHDKAFALMSIAYMAKKLSISLSKSNYEILHEAFEIAKTSGNQRTMAYAKYYMAQLYAEKRRYDEAIHLTRQAIFYTQNYPAELHIGLQRELWGYPELLFLLEWQLGKFLKAQQPEKHQIAIGKAYERADKHLKFVRLTYGNSSPSFLSDAKEFYFDWADFLLKRARQIKDGNEKKALLKEAIEVVESFEIAEVQEYYQNLCITKELEEQVEHLEDNLKSNEAIFYPLLFEDRIESLIITKKNRIEQDVHEHSNLKKIKNIIKMFRRNASYEINYGGYHKTTVYNWFRTSLEKLKTLKKIDTLIIVPHGQLYSIPFAVLYDDTATNEPYLIEKYALNLTPSLRLTNIKKLSEKHKY